MNALPMPQRPTLLPRLSAALLTAALLSSAACPALTQAQPKPAAHEMPSPQMDLPRTHLSSGIYRMQVQLAVAPQARQIGLMFRQNMPDNEGMLFVFEAPHRQCFWMRNTLIPLTAAFIDDAGRITNLADMQPQSDDSHCSTEPVRYVLEMNQGWFDKRKIKAGSTIKGLPTLGPAPAPTPAPASH